MIKNKIILVTGGAGSIGSEIVRQLAPKNTVYVVDLDETRMFDLVEELRHYGYETYGAVSDVMSNEFFDYGTRINPDYIFHCAARKHVSPMEETPIEAVNTNIRGTWNVIKLSKKLGSKLVNISTDKVTNGESIMGLTKKIAEKMVKNAGYISVRFGNVMGSRGSVLPIWQKQLDEGKPLTVTHEKMTRYMMTIPEACELVIRAAEIGKASTVMIMDMGKKVNILALAEQILEKSGKKSGITMIGVRPGEALEESLMTAEEEQRAKKFEKFWII